MISMYLLINEFSSAFITSKLEHMTPLFLSLIVVLSIPKLEKGLEISFEHHYNKHPYMQWRSPN